MALAQVASLSIGSNHHLPFHVISLLVQPESTLISNGNVALGTQSPSCKTPISPLKGKQVRGIAFDSGTQLTMTFSDGTVFVVSVRAGKLTAEVNNENIQIGKAAEAPTKRQLEYLSFIAKYIRRYGRSPAESDIERHFLVSAPSVNQMMQMLERRGFISRQPGVPRSTRINIDLGLYGETRDFNDDKTHNSQASFYPRRVAK